ncbi:MAG TPA: hypothetical protein VGD66_12130 [Allosphingosinicella sp.]
MHSFWFRIVIAAALLGLLPAAASAQAPTPAVIVQSAEEALAQDAAEYARIYDVAPEEAVRRLRAQAESVAATEGLRQAYRKRLAGLAIEHRPDYRIVILLTGSKPVPDRWIAAGGMTIPVVFRTGARATGERIIKAIVKRGDRIRAAVPQARGMGLDPRSGELVVMLSEPDADRLDLAALTDRVRDIAGVPARIRIIERPDADFAIEGGARVEGIDTVSGKRAYCTTGFVVTDGARTGVVTAAHCPDALTYLEPDGRRLALPFLGQWGWSFQDVQLNVSEEAQRPLFYADAKRDVVRAVTGSRPRSGTRAGDLVCHRGERSGYSCAEVELTDYAPPGDLCGGPCAPVWVTVAGPSCGGGDSGGPVFLGNIAYGIVKGGTYGRTGACAFYYYMSLDYLPQGWSLLEEDRPAAAPE